MQIKRVVVAVALLALVVAVGMRWTMRKERPPPQLRHAPRQPTTPMPKPAELPAEPPLAPRPAAAFPGAELVRLGALPAQLWRPVQHKTPWLLVYAQMPASLNASQGVVDLVRTVWQRQDVGAAVVLAQPTTATGDDPRLALAIEALVAQPDGNRPVVLLAIGNETAAALQVAGDPRVRALALVDPDAEAQPPVDQPAWRTVVGKKHALLAGPESAAGTARRLGDLLGNVRTVIADQQPGALWLTDSAHRAAVVGWLTSLLAAP